MGNNEPLGTTPLDPDETEGLLPGHVSTREELNALEAANIQIGLAWAKQRTVLARRPVDVLTESFLFQLHHRMFGEVWSWAGKVRRTNRNLGVDKADIRTELRKLVDDARMMADLLIQEAGGSPFTWGGRTLSITSELRSRYLSALRCADQGDIAPLLEFARA